MPRMIITAVDSINLSVSVVGLAATIGYFAYQLHQTNRTLAIVDKRLREHTIIMHMEQEKLSTVRGDLNARSCVLNHLGVRVTLLGVEVKGLGKEIKMIKQELEMIEEAKSSDED
ncbi:hypothetical protein NpNSSI1_00010069 [Neofusicoccum parvum]|uniref:Uncharacterized protein n=1 Tax=Botryosphaeria parva (strain UCR-NP2) TaxID=1287680 RepID=R1GLR3_BOTPV|nr:hypothetical protein UCRNP2_6332 [Neofusicoccum parvum UCRNP2]GME31303.1 hypothetical protein NpNSSI1_00010069 [Neofusicoccum parvum]